MDAPDDGLRAGMTIKIFVVGATGYQGSTLVHNLLAHTGKYEVTALVRTEQKGADLRELGCKTIVGDLSTTSALQQGAQNADVVFSLASADELAPVQTLVEALKPKGMFRNCQPSQFDTRARATAALAL